MPSTASGSRPMQRWAMVLLVFANAALLFTVEPVVARLALPLLGGTPSVWNTALVCFQLFLLLGYAYAHALTTWLTPAQQVRVHSAVLLGSLLTLPLHLHVTGAIPPGAAGVPWLALLFLRSIGVPFVVLATGAPLLQAWMVQGDTGTDANPYPLYAASNLGSFVALLAYPVLMEPMLTLTAQREVWSVAYGVLVIALVVLGWRVSRSAGARVRTPLVPVSDPADGDHAPPSVTARDRVWWTLCAAVPSSLLLGVTAKLSTDVAAIPLLWVMPLAVYLLTFVLAFAARPLLPHAVVVRVEPFLLIPVLLMDGWGSTLPGLAPVFVHLAVLLVVAMVCHGELARRRPAVAHLTEFYLWIALGGVIGGAFNALLAPLLFTSVLEYPLMLACAGFLRPSGAEGTSQASATHRRSPAADLTVPALVAALVLGGRWAPGAGPDVGPVPIAQVVTAAIASLLLLGAAARPRRFGAALLALVVAAQWPVARVATDAVVVSARSYFGVYRIREYPHDSLRELVHGTTVHGAQSMRAADRLAPRTYYHRDGPMGDVFTQTAAAARAVRRVGVVGLGVGSLACYGRVGEHWTYFEIDPEVVRLAQDPRWFSFLRDCPPTVHITVGDARQTLPSAGPAAFDILVLDAFSSDAIPVHLLTREAFARYAEALAPGGVLAVHISNRHLDLEPVVAAIARDGGWTALIRRDVGRGAEATRTGHSSSIWVALTRQASDLGGMQRDGRWQPLRPAGPLWSDEYSNVLGVLRWR